MIYAPPIAGLEFESIYYLHKEISFELYRESYDFMFLFGEKCSLQKSNTLEAFKTLPYKKVIKVFAVLHIENMAVTFGDDQEIMKRKSEVASETKLNYNSKIFCPDEKKIRQVDQN